MEKPKAFTNGLKAANGFERISRGLKKPTDKAFHRRVSSIRGDA